MTEENPLTIAELGAYTNNSMNREGIKKLVDKVNEGGGVEYTAGDNISISSENVISATDTKYTAGTNIEISEQNVISATDTKYTAGVGISISAENVISVSGEWVKRNDNNDWSDLFELISPYILKAKKDILFTYKKASDANSGAGVTFIPKGYQNSNEIILNISGGILANNTLKIPFFGKLLHSQIASGTTISGETQNVTFTTDGTTVTLSMTNNSATFSKSDFVIWTKD